MLTTYFHSQQLQSANTAFHERKKHVLSLLTFTNTHMKTQTKTTTLTSAHSLLSRFSAQAPPLPLVQLHPAAPVKLNSTSRSATAA